MKVNAKARQALAIHIIGANGVMILEGKPSQSNWRIYALDSKRSQAMRIEMCKELRAWLISNYISFWFDGIWIELGNSNAGGKNCHPKIVGTKYECPFCGKEIKVEVKGEK